MGFANERGAFLSEDFDISFAAGWKRPRSDFWCHSCWYFDCGTVHSSLSLMLSTEVIRSIHKIYKTTPEVKHSIEIAFEVNERSLDERYGFAETRRDRA